MLEDVSAREERNDECPVIAASWGRGGFAGGFAGAEDADVDLLTAVPAGVDADAGFGLLTDAA